MKKILVVSGHTNLENSVANKAILEEFSKLFPNAEIDYLDQLYPDFKIDVAAEQKKLIDADIIILQFPIFWYHMPSIMERWMEETFTHGFSHGRTGNKLKGKKLIASFTTGAPKELYKKDGVMGYEIDEFLPSIKATSKLTQMDFVGYIHTGGVSYQNRSDEKAIAEMKEKAILHAHKVANLVNKIEK